MRFVSLVLLGACAWEPPLDPDADALLNVIQGEIVASGMEETSQVLVLLYDVNDPPPPGGTGRPITFSTVPADAFTGDAAGIQSAPYSMTEVPDGTYLVTALMDMDGDFHPLLTAAAGSTCGDFAGAHLVDVSTASPAPVTVEGGELLDDVTILVASEYTIERPAFTFADNQAATGTTDPLEPFFTISSTAIHSAIIDLTGPFDGTDLCDTSFWVTVPDADGDGAPDAHPNPGFVDPNTGTPFPEIWPRVYLQYLGGGTVTLEEGESYVTEAIVYPDFLATGAVGLNSPTPLTTLNLVFPQAAQHTAADGAVSVVYLDEVPMGAWAVTVMNVAGQTWTLPNETAAFPENDPSDAFDAASQGAYLVVGPPSASSGDTGGADTGR